MESLIHFPGPPLAALRRPALSTALGMAQVAKTIQVYEAKHELKHGSAGFIRGRAASPDRGAPSASGLCRS